MDRGRDRAAAVGRVTLEYRIGDVFDRLAEIPDGSIDLIVTSPPFLALRSYLPADHPDKHKEIGSEPTPAEFIDTLLALSAEWARVLAPHGSLCVELGDTYSGSTAGGGDHKPEGVPTKYKRGDLTDASTIKRRGDAWPLAKSLTGIPTLYTWSLAYGRNLLTGNPSPAGQWRIRNLIVWARPNPPVGALGDKFRPATSYITVACKGAKRYFDLDAVRTDAQQQTQRNTNGVKGGQVHAGDEGVVKQYDVRLNSNPAGAPPLDWHADDHPEDGDWLWKLSTQPYAGAHFATYPLALPTRLIKAMCPQRVCTQCGKPSERIVGDAEYVNNAGRPARMDMNDVRLAEGVRQFAGTGDNSAHRVAPTLGWTDCGHDAWRTGIVLDPFMGSGSTMVAAQSVGRHAIGIDIDHRNADLARDRVGMFMTVDEQSTQPGASPRTLIGAPADGQLDFQQTGSRDDR